MDENIWMAAGDGHLDAVRQFLDSGVSVNAKDDTGYTPLAAACSYGNTEVAKFLLEKGADAKISDNDGDTPLHVCESPECADLLLAAGAELTAQNNKGYTPYHCSTWEYREEMLEWLKSKYAARQLSLPEVPPESDEEEDGDDDDQQ